MFIKMLRLFATFLVLLLYFQAYTQQDTMHHIFYLHGMIIESQGINAVSPAFGPYEYTNIINTLKDSGAVVHHVVRTEKTDFYAFGDSVSKEINLLIQNGVPAENISVVGASKGGLIAMYISHINSYNVNYILLGASSDYAQNTFDWNLHGSILGIYEKSDTVAPNNYRYWIDKSTNATRFEQLAINTGLNHGFLYRPLDAWMLPTMEWIGIPGD